MPVLWTRAARRARGLDKVRALRPRVGRVEAHRAPAPAARVFRRQREIAFPIAVARRFHLYSPRGTSRPATAIVFSWGVAFGHYVPRTGTIRFLRAFTLVSGSPISWARGTYRRRQADAGELGMSVLFLGSFYCPASVSAPVRLHGHPAAPRFTANFHDE